MKYHKLFMGDLITIDSIAYMVVSGLAYNKRAELKQGKYNKLVYNVHLKTVKYIDEKANRDIFCKNTELKNFEKVK